MTGLPRIDPARAARLAALSDYEKSTLGTFLADILRWGVGPPPASGETPWEHCGKTWWQRWFRGSLCVIQKRGREYELRINGTPTYVSTELWQAKGSAEIHHTFDTPPELPVTLFTLLRDPHDGKI